MLNTRLLYILEQPGRGGGEWSLNAIENMKTTFGCKNWRKNKRGKKGQVEWRMMLWPDFVSKEDGCLCSL